MSDIDGADSLPSKHAKSGGPAIMETVERHKPQDGGGGE